MTIVRIDSTQWTSGLKAVSKTYTLFGPKKNKSSYAFQSLDNGELPSLHFANTTLPPKNILFPQSAKILEYSLDASKGTTSDLKVVKKESLKKAIIGIRPCDARANLILNMNFDTTKTKDPYWLEAYNSTTFVGLACDSPCNTCFCTTAGSNPYGTEGLDLILLPLKDNQYYAKVITKKGEKFLDEAGWQNLPNGTSSIFEKHKARAEAKISSKISTNRLKDIEILSLHSALFWDDISFACINCGTCTFTCPTCWCFDIQDEIWGKLGTRMKNWDSCMFPIFTVHTTGHNPRETKTQRVRQRFMHKLKYFVDNYNAGVMCVGCGRCIRSCPVNIDIRKVCKLMNSFKPENACNVQDN